MFTVGGPMFTVVPCLRWSNVHGGPMFVEVPCSRSVVQCSRWSHVYDDQMFTVVPCSQWCNVHLFDSKYTAEPLYHVY